MTAVVSAVAWLDTDQVPVAVCDVTVEVGAAVPVRRHHPLVLARAGVDPTKVPAHSSVADIGRNKLIRALRTEHPWAAELLMAPRGLRPTAEGTL